MSLGVGSRLDWLIQQQADTCYLCGWHPIDEPSEDHILPQSKGGTHVLGNFAAACARCNSSRGNQPLTEAQRNRLRAYYRRDVDSTGAFVGWTDGTPPSSFREASWRWSQGSKKKRKRGRRRKKLHPAAQPAAVSQALVDYDPWVHDIYE